MSNIAIISLLFAAVALTATVSSALTSKKMRRKVSYMLDALED